MVKKLWHQYKYIKVLLIGLKNSIEYRTDFLLGLLSCFFPILIQLYLWTVIFDKSAKATVFGYTYMQMVMYSVLAALVTKLVSTGFEGEIYNDIKNGILSKYLIQPIIYSFYRAFKFIGERLFHLIIIFCLTMVFLFFLGIKDYIEINTFRIFLFIIVIALSLVLNFLISYTVSIIAFWVHECGGIFLAITIISTVIAGGIFPLDIFGKTVVNISKMFPFYYLINFPVNILNNRIDFYNIYLGMTIQAVWILALLLASKLLWKIGMKRYIASGG